MYCINCGVKLADTESKCPLCNTVVFHPEIYQSTVEPLYPRNKMPKDTTDSKVLNGAILILFFIPLIICLISDLQIDGTLDWFGYLAGASIVTYVMFALPIWFKKPNPVIFVPCSFVAVGLYLLYINMAVGGQWFLSFALPVIGGLGLLTTAVVTLLYYIKRGRLYIFGGAFIALGGFMLLMEYLLTLTIDIKFIGWSIYPAVVSVLLGGILIYLAIDSVAREVVERKLFF